MKSLQLLNGCFVTVLSFAQLGCDLQKQVDDLKKESKEWRKDLEKTRGTISQVADSTTKAIPGGYFNLLIADLYGDDDKKRERARATLERMMGKGALSPMNLEVFVSSNQPDQPLHALFYLVDTPEAVTVEGHLIAHPAFTNTKQGNLHPLTEQEVESRINTALDEFMTLCFGSPFWSSNDLDVLPHEGSTRRQVVSQFWSSQVMPGGFYMLDPAVGNKQLDKWWHEKDAATSARTKARDKVREAILAAHREHFSSEGSPSVRFPWLPLQQKYLVVVLRKSDWLARKASLKITAQLVQDGHPLSDAPPQQVSNSFFDTKPELKDPDGSPDPLVWAPLNITGKNVLTGESLAAWKKLQEVAAQWKQEAQSQK